MTLLIHKGASTDDNNCKDKCLSAVAFNLTVGNTLRNKVEDEMEEGQAAFKKWRMTISLK